MPTTPVQKKEKMRDDTRYRAYVFAVTVVKLIDENKKNSITFDILARQLVKSATSISANIVEAQAGSSKKDFTNFLSHALKSANETKFWLCLLRDTQKLAKNDIDHLLHEVEELANILGASVRTLREKKR